MIHHPTRALTNPQDPGANRREGRLNGRTILFGDPECLPASTAVPPAFRGTRHSNDPGLTAAAANDLLPIESYLITTTVTSFSSTPWTRPTEVTRKTRAAVPSKVPR